MNGRLGNYSRFFGKLACVLLLMLLSESDAAAQRKPLAHIPPPGSQIKRIPAPVQSTIRPGLNVSAESTSPKSDADAIAEKRFQVQQASYEADLLSRSAQRVPVSDSSTSTRPAGRYYGGVAPSAAAASPFRYKLKHHSYQQFEQKLADIWGERLTGKPLDSTNRAVRIFLPAGKSAPETPMTFDRVAGELTYEGPPAGQQEWLLLIQALDRPRIPGDTMAVEIVDVGQANRSLIQQVTWMVQEDPFNFDPQNPPPNRQQDPDDDKTYDIVERPPQFTQEAIDRLKNEVPQLDGVVEVRPSGNNLILIGSESDVAKVKAYIKKLIELSDEMQPVVKRIELFNADAEELVEQIRLIYENQFLNISGPVEISPDAFSSAIVVVGSQGGVDAVERIVREFEGQKKDPAADDEPLSDDQKGYLIYRLRHLSAVTAQRLVLEFFGQSANAQSNDPVAPKPVTAIVEERANSLTIIAGPDLRRKAKVFLDEIDRPTGDKQRSIRVFAIKNQVAGDLALIVQDILGGGAQQNTGITETQNNNLNNQNNFNQNQNFGGQQSTQPQTGITTLQFQGRDGRVTDGGVLFDARLTSNNASNTIAVVAPEENMDLIAELIEELDQLPDVASEFKVLPIYHGDAREILASLEQIFTGGQQGLQQGGFGQGQNQNALGNLPLQSAAGAGGSSLANLRFAVNDRTNTILVAGSQADVEFVEALVQRLDEPDVRDRETWVYRLSNAFVTDVATALNTWLDERQAIFEANPIAGGGQAGTNGGVNLARRDVIVVEVEASNMLIVNARREEMPAIEHVIRALDRMPPMVKIKAMIVQVNLSQLENFGIEFGLQDSQIFDAGLSDAIGTGFVGIDNVAGQVISDLGVGRMSANAGIPGFVLSAGDESLNFILRFLKQKGCANVLFSPQVMTMENLEGRFTSGAEIQRIGQLTSVGLGGAVQQGVENVDIGITLAVTPRVTPDGLIVMFVDVSNTSLGEEANGTVIGTDQNGNAIRSAPINQTAAQTTIMCRPGQTVALSGLIQQNKGQTITSLPILGDLPVVGPLFQSVENTASRMETLIILTPFIADGADDLNVLNQDDFDRMHWCQCDVAEVYGNTSYTGQAYREQTPKVFYPDTDPLGNGLTTGYDARTSAPYTGGSGYNGSENRSGESGDVLQPMNQPESVYPSEEGWRDAEQQLPDSLPPSQRGGHGNSSRMQGYEVPSGHFGQLQPQVPRGGPDRRMATPVSQFARRPQVAASPQTRSGYRLHPAVRTNAVSTGRGN